MRSSGEASAYPLASDGDELIRNLIRTLFGKDRNVNISPNQVAYAKLFNVQRSAEFCDLSTMNGMFRKGQFHIILLDSIDQKLSICMLRGQTKLYIYLVTRMISSLHLLSRETR